VESGNRNPGSVLKVEHVSRPQVIDRIRKALLRMTDEDHCMCAAANRLDVFCHGFRRLSDEEFRLRFDWIARKRTKASRTDLEELVNLYHLGRQEVTGVALCCDIETHEHCACDGWNTFDNKSLEKVCLALTGQPVQIG
jgi:hypothetical protein